MPLVAVTGVAALLVALRVFSAVSSVSSMIAAAVLAEATHVLDSPLAVMAAIVGILGANATFLYTSTRIYRQNNDELRDQLAAEGQRIDRLERDLRNAEVTAAGQRELKHQALAQVAELQGKLAERPDLTVVLEAIKDQRTELLGVLRDLSTARTDGQP